MHHIDITYIELLREHKDKNPIKIPKYLSDSLIKNQELFKAVCVYFELKPLFYDGFFRQRKNLLGHLAYHLGMSVSAFRYKLNVLRKNGLVSYKGKDLKLCSWSTFFELFDLSEKHNKRSRFYCLKNIYSNSEYLVRYYAIAENFENQRKAIDRRIYKKHVVEGQQMGILSQINDIQKNSEIAIEDRQRLVNNLINQLNSTHLSNDQEKEFYKFKKKGFFNSIYIQECSNYFKQLNTFNYVPEINYDITLSCKGMARIFGLNSASSGHYWQQKFKGHFWEIENRSLFIPNISSTELYHANQTGNTEFHYFQGRKRGVFRRLPNLVKLFPLYTI